MTESQSWASGVQKMTDPYVEGRRIRRENIFRQAAFLRYMAVKYPEQRHWSELSAKDQQLWIDVQVESFNALVQALHERHDSVLEFFVEAGA